MGFSEKRVELKRCMLTRMKCSTGHEWEAGEGTASSICPKCGSPAVTATDAAHMEDPEQTLDVAVHHAMKFPDQTETSDVTQTFTPAPTPVMPPPPGGTKGGGSSAGSGQTLAGRLGDNRPSKDAANLAASGMPFSIIRQHARGGLGVVNLAKDIYIKREVALKQILPQHKENGILQRRFLYEAQITGQLEHPSIVPVYCLGQDATTNPYYVMRFVKGRTLDEIIKEHHQAPNPIVFRELLRSAGGHHLLRQNVERVAGNLQAVQLAVADGPHQGGAFDQLIARGGEDAAFG